MATEKMATPAEKMAAEKMAKMYEYSYRLLASTCTHFIINILFLTYSKYSGQYFNI